jgi:hypothetical protein
MFSSSVEAFASSAFTPVSAARVSMTSVNDD